ncbi:MAG: ATP-binding cassette domain-containing protein, partial [Candidatus Hodarchaeales archaeon]
YLAGKKIGRRVVGVQNVSFNVKKGEIFGFLGPNGAGKTTTIRAILNYLTLQSGKITVFGLDHKIDALTIRENIGYVPGDVALYGNFTGLELIEYFNNFRPIDRDFLAVLRSYFKADLTLKIKSLSSGNRQQVALFVALASKPDFLILDEPSSGLDPLMESHLHKILRDLQANGTTIFLSSHDLAEVQAICDRVGIIKEGKIILIEEVEELREKSLQQAIIQFEDGLPDEEEFTALDTVISVEKVNGYTYKMKIKEDVNNLMKLLTNYKIKRLTVEDASLQEIFLEYYK